MSKNERTRLLNQRTRKITENSTKGRKLPQYAAALAANGGAFIVGTILSWTCPAEESLLNHKSFYNFAISTEQYSWIGAFVTLGAICICIPVGSLANIFGRKRTMLLLVIPFTIGWALMLFAKNVTHMYIGRFMLGIAGGSFCVTAPMYTGEIAQNDIRGTLGTFFQLMLTMGVLFVYVIGACVSVFYLNVICGVIPLVFGVIFFFMPESPTYYVIKGRYDDALESLKWLRGPKYDCQNDLEELKNDQNALHANTSNSGQALKRTESLRSAFIAIGLMFFQQMSGINVIVFYTTRIFTDSGSDINPQLSTIIVGAIDVVATLFSATVVDKLGRRFLLLVSIVVMAVCLCGLGVFFYLKDLNSDTIDHLNWLPITSLCVFIVAIALGYGPVPWLMLGELFTPDTKGFLAAVCGTFNWILAFVITKFFNNFQEALGNGPTFFVFTGFCVIGFFFTVLFVPETKGKSFHTIQNEIKSQCIHILKKRRNTCTTAPT